MSGQLEINDSLIVYNGSANNAITSGLIHNNYITRIQDVSNTENKTTLHVSSNRWENKHDVMEVGYLNTAAGIFTNMFNIQGDGKIGIGNNQPDTLLHIHTTNSNNQGTINSAEDYIVLEGDGDDYITILNPTNDPGRSGIRWNDENASAGSIEYVHATDTLS